MVNVFLRWPTPKTAPRSVVITGASEGIGAAFAEHYAGAGVVLCLTARSLARLDGVAARCRAKGAVVVAVAVDVQDEGRMREVLTRFDGEHPVDLLIANAGVSEVTTGIGTGTAALESAARVLTSVNLYGVFNTVFPLLDAMRARRSGQIAVVSSIGGFGGAPQYTAYCAGKTAVRAFAQGLRVRVACDGVAVSDINPGFVDTAMTRANNFSMPWLLRPHEVAEIVAEGLSSNVGSITMPMPMHLIAYLTQLMLPDAVRDAILLPFMPTGN